MGFDSLGLSKKILENIKKQGYSEPTPIQSQAIPVVLDGKDIMAAAQTGTGKTAGFALPILQLLESRQKVKSNQTKVLILAPTRELASQINDDILGYKENLNIKSVVVFGGVKINPQMQKLRSGVDILVATPGRLLDLHNQNAIKFNELEFLVLDEADRMLDMGFINDIRKIIALLPKKRQNILFSATFSDDIRKLAKEIVNNPIEISVTPRNTTATTVEQIVHPVDKKQKSALLLELININNWHQVLVFVRTKHGANRLVKFLDKHKVKSLAIHGNKSQGARTRALKEFKANSIQVLVATDIAARGIDIEQLPFVVNFDLPNVPEDYIHRIGRTGRAGSTGEAISLVCADEIKELVGIERLTQKLLTRKLIDGFEPDHDVPESDLLKPYKPKRAKKTGQRSRTGGRTGEKSTGRTSRTGRTNGKFGKRNSNNERNSEERKGSGNLRSRKNSSRGKAKTTNSKSGSSTNNYYRKSSSK